MVVNTLSRKKSDRLVSCQWRYATDRWPVRRAKKAARAILEHWLSKDERSEIINKERELGRQRSQEVAVGHALWPFTSDKGLDREGFQVSCLEASLA